VSDRLVLLGTSATVRPGLLSWPAWRVLAGASRVLVGSPDHPLLPALDEAGVSWQLLPGAEVPSADKGESGAEAPSLADGGLAAGGGESTADAPPDGGSAPAPDAPPDAGSAPVPDAPPGAGGGPGPADLARLLTAAAARVTGTVVWLCDTGGIAGFPSSADGGPEALAQALDELEAAEAAPAMAGRVEVLRGSADLPGGHLLRLVAVMDTLRTKCPWDARQTHETLAPHLLEESYEALEALESGDARALREELGDVLLQVVFHARVAAERSDGTGYTVDDVADGIVTKLVRRHPHVFGDVTVSGADEVKRNWDAIKAAERESAAGVPGSALDGVPFGQPALALAAQLQRRAERAGVPADLADLPPADQDGDIGAQLFALVAKARAADIDPELELRAAARRYRDRVHDWERSRPT
jgi:NTP pyrophosphatase (non-canonical NTP hydrolase)